jgi:hypothetical protein
MCCIVPKCLYVCVVKGKGRLKTGLVKVAELL